MLIRASHILEFGNPRTPPGQRRRWWYECFHIDVDIIHVIVLADPNPAFIRQRALERQECGAGDATNIDAADIRPAVRTFVAGRARTSRARTRTSTEVLEM